MTDDDDIATSCYRLKNHGRDSKGIFKHQHIGYNFSFTEMQAAIGISQMEKLDSIISKKEYFHKKYREELNGIGDLYFFDVDSNVRPVHWFTSVLTDYRTELSDYLLENGIQTRFFFYPLHLQPCYEDVLDLNGSFDVSEKMYNKGLSLPSSYNLSDEEFDYVVEKIKEFFNK